MKALNRILVLFVMISCGDGTFYISHIQDVVDHNNIKEEFSICYLLDSSCSACIVECLSFLSEIKKSHYKQSVRIYVSADYIDIFNYYISQSHVEITDNVHVLQLNSDFPFGYEGGHVLYIISQRDDNYWAVF